MALEEAMGVAEAFRFAAQHALAKRQLDQVKEERDTQAQLARDRFNEEIKQHQENAKRQATLDKAQLDVYGANLSQLGQKALDNILQGGAPPPGTTISPTASSLPSGEANFSPMNPQQATGQIVQMPGYAPQQTPTTEGYAQNQSRLWDMVNAAKNKQELVKEAAKQAEIEKGKVEMAAAMMDRLNTSKKYDEDRAAATAEAAWKRDKYRVDADNANRLTIANINAKKGTEPLYDIKPHVLDGLNGNVTQEVFNKVQLPKGDKQAITDAMTQIGARFLTDKQKELFDTMQGASEALKPMTDLIDKSSYSEGTTDAIPLAAKDYLNSDIRAIHNRLQGRALMMASVVSGQPPSRISDPDVKATLKGYIPTLLDTTKNKIIQYDSFVDILNKKIKTQLKDFSEKQQSVLAANIGYPFSHYEGNKTASVSKKATSPVGSNPVQAPSQINPAATHVWTPNGIQSIGQH